MKNNKEKLIIVRNIFKHMEKLYEWEKDDVAIVFCSISSAGKEHPEYRFNKDKYQRIPVMFDVDDLDLIMNAPASEWKITISKGSAYATCWGTWNGIKQSLKMHWLAANHRPAIDEAIDHYYHHALDNRKGNLIVTTRAENCKNLKYREDPQKLFVPEIDSIIEQAGEYEAVKTLRLFNEKNYEQTTFFD